MTENANMSAYRARAYRLGGIAFIGCAVAGIVTSIWVAQVVVVTLIDIGIGLIVLSQVARRSPKWQEMKQRMTEARTMTRD